MRAPPLTHTHTHLPPQPAVDFRISVIGESSGNKLFHFHRRTDPRTHTHTHTPAAYRPEHGFLTTSTLYGRMCHILHTCTLNSSAFQRLIRLLALVSMQLREWTREPLISSLLIPDLPLSLDRLIAATAYRRKNLLLQTYGCTYWRNRAPRPWGGLQGQLLTRQRISPPPPLF